MVCVSFFPTPTMYIMFEYVYLYMLYMLVCLHVCACSRLRHLRVAKVLYAIKSIFSVLFYSFSAATL